LLTPSLDKRRASQGVSLLSLHLATAAVKKSSRKRPALALLEPVVYVERGVKCFRHSRVCLVFGENAGDILLSFAPKDWSEVKILGDSDDKWMVLASTGLESVTFIQRQDIRGAMSSCDVLLGAGSRPLLTARLSEMPTTKPVLLFTKGSAARRLPHFQSRYLPHEGMGGATNWKGMAWSRGWKSKAYTPTVKRNIGHLLTHSGLPRPCKPDPAFLHLTPEDLYPVEGSELSVVFPTHASYTNWGHRRLNQKEVACTLDLPVWLVQDTDKLSFWTSRHSKGLVMPLKPLQIMSQLLLDSLLPAGSDSDPVVKQQPGDFVAPTSTWLSAIGKTLPHTWSNPTVVSATAVKTDDAAVAVGIWDQRVSLVFPWDHLNMASLRA
jgi:hypothetical protein